MDRESIKKETHHQRTEDSSVRFRLLSVPTNGSLGILSRSSDEGNEKSEKERFKGSGSSLLLLGIPLLVVIFLVGLTIISNMISFAL